MGRRRGVALVKAAFLPSLLFLTLVLPTLPHAIPIGQATAFPLSAHLPTIAVMGAALAFTLLAIADIQIRKSKVRSRIT